MRMTVAVVADVGAGAVCVLDALGELRLVEDLMQIGDCGLRWFDAGSLQRQVLDTLAGHDGRGLVEKPRARPRGRAPGAFAHALGLGSVLATLQACQVSVEFIAPATWRRAHGLSGNAREALDKARLLFPAADLGRTDYARARALLLARWALGLFPRSGIQLSHCADETHPSPR